MNDSQLETWIGKEEVVQDHISEAPLKAMSATLELPIENRSQDFLPPLWHWLYFLETAPHSRLADDGHQQRGDFLPPVALPRRMWAGSKLHFSKSLPVGSSAKRISRIKSIDQKQGRSGELVFVSVQHQIFSNDELAITEEQNIVYREGATQSTTASGKTAPTNADFEKLITPDPLLLFRYSALTFNAHRIHYDRPYATETEGYPGLVVHGPLLATYLITLLTEQYPQRDISEFEFRAVKPIFDLNPFTIAGNAPDTDDRCSLWAADIEGNLCMQASAKLHA